VGIGAILYRIFDVLRNVLIVVFFSVIIVTCFTDVVLRYAPWFQSLGWTEEILRYLNVWIILLGASVAAKRKGHLAMQYFLRVFRSKHQAVIGQFVHVTILVFLAIMIIFSTQKTLQNIQQQVQAFPITIAWFYLAIPVGSFYMFIDYLLILIYGNHPFSEPMEE
jgi:TRAP-type C4-dicarboxylate transport system permease small subunit